MSGVEPEPAPAPPPAFPHPESWLSLPDTAVDRRFAMPYRKTYGFDGPYIDPVHRGFAECPLREGMIDVGIPGWLLPADALKLYEMVRFSGGDVLELGTFRGLSASVALRAIEAAGRADVLISIDLDPDAPEAAAANLARLPGADRARFFTTTADEALETFTGARRLFRFCFVDHSHRYEHVLSACRLLPGVLEPGAFCLFHDYNDPRNSDAAVEDYGVHQAVGDGLDPALFGFWGIYGCTGLFRFGG